MATLIPKSEDGKQYVRCVKCKNDKFKRDFKHTILGRTLTNALPVQFKAFKGMNTNRLTKQNSKKNKKNITIQLRV